MATVISLAAPTHVAVERHCTVTINAIATAIVVINASVKKNALVTLSL